MPCEILYLFVSESFHVTAVEQIKERSALEKALEYLKNEPPPIFCGNPIDRRLNGFVRTTLVNRRF